MLLAVYCLGDCLSAVAATTTGSKISGRGVADVGEVHVSVDLVTTIQRTSMVRSVISVWSWMLSP